MRYKRFYGNEEMFVRDIPAAKRVPAYLKEKLERKLLPELASLLTKPKTPFQVVEHLENQFLDKDEGYVVEELHDEPYPAGTLFVKERNSEAFCLIKPGPVRYDVRDGCNIIVAHVDSPCLRLRDLPTRFDTDHELRYLQQGPMLEARPVGGIEARDWHNLEGTICGRIYTEGGVEKRVNVPGKIPGLSVHFITEEYTPSYNDLQITTGVNSISALYKQFGVKTETDFASAELFFYPNTSYFRYGDYVSAYGLDDRACVMAAFRALSETTPRRPTFVFGLAAEERGSPGMAAKTKGFFESVLLRFFKDRHHLEYSTLEQLYTAGVIGQVPAICADVAGVISTPEKPLYQRDVVSDLESPRYGFGPFVNASWAEYDANAINPVMMRYFIDAFNEKISDHFQVTGAEHTPDFTADGQFGGHFAEHFTNDYVPMVAVGVALGGLHRPTGENMNIWDYLYLVQAYKTYMRFNPGKNTYRG